jgi:hypothetical protein
MLKNLSALMAVNGPLAWELQSPRSARHPSVRSLGSRATNDPATDPS